MDTETQLVDGIAALGLKLPSRAVADLLRYTSLLEKWNRVYNLTAIRERSRLVSHHLLDSLAVVPLLPAGRLVDVGSGAGLPGIPLAIARPESAVTLLDSNHKKGAFLRQAVLELGLENIQVTIARAEEWEPAQRFDVAVSRAFSDLSGFIEASAHLLKPDGVFAAMKGVYPDEELTQLPVGITLESVTALSVPGLRAARHLVLLRIGR
jgi:16S rRNA (guanine527-N7)-methyltransferase